MVFVAPSRLERAYRDLPICRGAGEFWRMMATARTARTGVVANERIARIAPRAFGVA
jgi:hypothetical protein